STNPDGSLSTKSMVYTEYFARGTQPTEYCDIHQVPGIMTRIASSVGIIDKPSPRIETIGVPTPPPPASPPDARPTTTSYDSPAPTTTAKRRGIWSRIFGIGRGGQSREPESQPPKNPPR